jgi:ATP-binding cassette, subfamily B, bacterial PglK
MILVTAGVGAILPIVGVIVGGETDTDGQFVSAIKELIGVSNQRTMLIVLVVGFCILIGLKVIVGLWVLVEQKKLNAAIRLSVTDRLFCHLIGMPYSFHTSENSANALRSLTSDISSHGRCIESSIIISSEALLVIALVTLLGVVDPVGLAMIASLVSIGGLIYFKSIHSKIEKWGKFFREESASMINHTQQALGGIKEIKVLNREIFFEQLFKKSVGRMIDYERKFAVMQALPVNFIEILIALGVVGIVVGVNIQEKEIAAVAPVLALFMATAVRLGPSLARVAGAFQTLRYNRPAITALYTRLKDESSYGQKCEYTDTSEPIENWHQLTIKNLNFSYPVRENFSLKDINVKIARGSSLGIFGESGSGKSTLMDILLGLITDYEGEIFIDDVDFKRARKYWQSQVGYVPQSVFLTDDSLRKNIAFGVINEKIDEQQLQLAIDQAQLRSFVNSLEDGIDSIVGERGARISGGQQQRVGIARALYRNPSILVLDEATSALDSQTEAEFMETITKMPGGITKIVIAHRVSTLSGCDNLIRLGQGRVLEEGTYRNLIESL